MVKINPEFKKKLLTYARAAIEDNKPVEQVMKELGDCAIAFAKDVIKDRENQECGVSYVGLKQKNQQEIEFKSSPELYIWALGLICEYWLLFLYKQKSIEGHCYNHKEPCTKSSVFHNSLFEEAKRSYVEIANQDFKDDIETEKIELLKGKIK